MCDSHRRAFILKMTAGGLLLSPLATVLPAFARDADGTDDISIEWGRDVCTRCKMVIKDFRFAAGMYAGGDKPVFRFDDLGCMVLWMRDQLAAHPWMEDAATQLRITAMDSTLERVEWLDARKAHYSNVRSPMGFNFGALAQPDAQAQKDWTFADARQHILTHGKARHD